MFNVRVFGRRVYPAQNVISSTKYLGFISFLLKISSNLVYKHILLPEVGTTGNHVFETFKVDQPHGAFECPL